MGNPESARELFLAGSLAPIDPWGVIIDRLPRGSGIVIGAMNPDYVQRVRTNLPQGRPSRST